MLEESITVNPSNMTCTATKKSIGSLDVFTLTCLVTNTAAAYVEIPSLFGRLERILTRGISMTATRSYTICDIGFTGLDALSGGGANLIVNAASNQLSPAGLATPVVLEFDGLSFNLAAATANDNFVVQLFVRR